MKRSEINNCIKKAMQFAKSMKVNFPPFAFWPPEKWQNPGPQLHEIRDLMLGWDVTDFGLGDFYKTGRTLFTLRNGSYRFEKYPRTYSEKFIFIELYQVTVLLRNFLMHFLIGKLRKYYGFLELFEIWIMFRRSI